MTPEPTQSMEQLITTALAGSVSSLKEVDTGRWHFALVNGAVLRGSAAMDEAWLTLEADLPEAGRPLNLWRMLGRNAQAGGGAKFIYVPDRAVARRGEVRLRAEIPLDAGAALAERIRLACQGCKQAHEARPRPGRAAEVDAATSAPADDAPAGEDLGELCSQAGWEHRQRASGRVSVALPVGTESYHAILDRTPAGALRAAVELGTVAKPSRPTRQALGLLLLTAGGLVRMVRPAAETEGSAARLSFEMVFDLPPSAGELSHALAALSVACRLCGREARVLEDQAVAAEYLSVRGWSPDHA